MIDQGIVHNCSSLQFPTLGKNPTSLHFWMQKGLCDSFYYELKWKCVCYLPWIFALGTWDTYRCPNEGYCISHYILEWCPLRPLFFPSGYYSLSQCQDHQSRRENFPRPQTAGFPLLFTALINSPCLLTSFCQHFLPVRTELAKFSPYADPKPNLQPRGSSCSLSKNNVVEK